MTVSDSTRPSLLLRLRHEDDQAAWEQFVEVYSPFVYAFLRRRGLQDADAGDITQEVLKTVVRYLRGFERQREGSFRNWLITIARSRLSDFLATQRRGILAAGGTAALAQLQEQPSPDDEERFLEQQYRKCVFEWAAKRVRKTTRESTWQAFWQTHIKGRECKEVAESLGLSVEAVYMARCRVLARLKKEVEQLER